ncbi:MAG: sigma-54-dependent Fis family transcriptional regulator [Nitrospira sp.]|nr:sigma-54-dependent Fis family transcriptional regulator [Nitrospira sp.]
MSKILVIDDEPIIRTSCERCLKPEGYEIKTTATGAEGLEFLKNEPFDLVLLDLMMPDMDGMEVLQMIKKTYPSIKVIMITGYSTVDTAVDTLRMGAFNYLQKPFNPDTLLNAVKDAVDPVESN